MALTDPESCVDEIAGFHLGNSGFSERYEPDNVMMTTNLPFDE
jgi:hypothetical protein